MIRIRGIYTTALTRLLSDAGYEFSDITPITHSRFGSEIKMTQKPPSVTIKDRNDQKGVVLLGTPENVKRISALITSTVTGSLGVYIKEGPYTSYAVKILSKTDKGYIVELPGGKHGYLFSDSEHTPGSLVRAHVVKPSATTPRLREGLALVGTYIRLIEGGRHSVSRHIRGEQRKIELLQLAFRSASAKWGIRFRSSAAEAPLLQVAEEINVLIRAAENILTERPSQPSLLALGEALADIYFPQPATDILDSIRCRQVPTLPLHHELKSIGEQSLDSKIDFAESSVTSSACFSKEKIYRTHYLPRAGLNRHTVLLHHVKLLDEGFIWAAKPNYDTSSETILLERKVTSPGTYDGLGAEKEPGDTILSYTYLGSKVIVHEYRGVNGDLKGMYININTPLSLYSPGELWYIDLEVDIVVPRGQTPRLIDVEKFDELFSLCLAQPHYISLYKRFVGFLLEELKRRKLTPLEILSHTRSIEKEIFGS